MNVRYWFVNGSAPAPPVADTTSPVATMLSLAATITVGALGLLDWRAGSRSVSRYLKQVSGSRLSCGPSLYMQKYLSIFVLLLGCVGVQANVVNLYIYIQNVGSTVWTPDSCGGTFVYLNSDAYNSCGEIMLYKNSNTPVGLPASLAPGQKYLLGNFWGYYVQPGSSQDACGGIYATYSDANIQVTGHDFQTLGPYNQSYSGSDSDLSGTINVTSDGCSDTTNAPVNDGPDNNSPGGGSDGSCSSDCGCNGMPVWKISEPYSSLWLYDEPLGYQPAVGPRISFKMAFKQRETTNGLNPNIFSVGKRWNFSWLSYVTQDQHGSNVVSFPYGGQQTFYAASNYLTNTRLTGDTNSGFTLTYPNGSRDVYGFVVTNSTGAFEEAFMTAHLNAQSQGTAFNYAGYIPGPSPVIRLQSVVDGDGHTNRIYYVASNSFSTNLISQVIDPFGRTNFLAYNNNGDLTNTIDVAGNSSSLGCDANDWVTNLITPYGATTFAIVDGTNNTFANGRSVLVGRPDGSHELYLFEDWASGAISTYGTIPNTSPFSNTFANTNLNYCDSYYWGPRQYAALSTTTISNFTTADFLKARMKHWLLQPADGTVGETLSMMRDPSPDSAGTIEGEKTWYDYAGKTNPLFEGTQAAPLFVARVLSDGTTSFKRTDRNSFGAVIDEISTYSANGGVSLRTNTYSYDPNNIDLIVTTNALGVQISSNTYNANHEIITNYNALNELTTYTYDSSNRLTSTTLPSGLVTTNIYGADGFLTRQVSIGYATNSYTYTNALLNTHTDPRGLTTTNLWDNLNRQTCTIFPDGSYVSNQYNALDLIGTRDRLGNWTFYGYDSMRRKVAETNALGGVTLYDYCTCGSLDSILDAGGNLTSFYYDNQGNRTNTVYADGYSVTNIFNLLKQVVSTSDSSGVSVINTYNNQGLVVAVNNAFGLTQSTAYDVLDRATNTVDANGVGINTTYDNLNRLLARSYPDGGVENWGYTLNFVGPTSYTNQIGNAALYGYDAMNRKTSEVSVGVMTNQFDYDGVGDLLTLTDGKNQTTTWGYDSFGRVTNKMDAAGIVDFVYQYDADNQLTNRWTPAKGNTGYTYDNVGNLKSINYQLSTINYSYDALNRRTNMVDGVGTTAFSYDAVGELLSAGGLWSGDPVTYTYTNRLRAALSVGSWNQTYGYDAAKRLKNLTSPAGTFGYVYGAPSTASALVNEITLPNSAFITNTFDSLARLTGTCLKNSGNNVLDGYTYAYNQLGQRTNIVRNYGLMSSTASAGYDAIGELTSWTARDANGTNRLNEKLGYAYDAAGNLNQRTNNTLVQSFNVNNLNELTTVTRSGALTVSGNTPVPASSVVVNGHPALTYGDFTFASSNGFTLADGQNSFTNVAWNYYGTVAVTNTVTAYLPATVTLQFDANGNLTNDGTRSLSYDTENQLTNVTVAGQWREDFLYDGLNRRRITRQYFWQSGSWALINETRFIYDGNVVIQERDSNNVAQVTYTRGLDISGSLQGAGGIGGLLARSDTNSSTFYHADGNGNITGLMDTNQYLVARYLYNPFGRTLGKWGTLADANVYRFSSKEFDANSGLYYYLRRFYDPNLQRWPNRDPIQELGGLNLYAYTVNDPINKLDPLGESTATGILSLIPFVGTIYNWLSNPSGSHVSDYKIDLSNCNLDIDQAESTCKQKVSLQQANYILQNNGLTLAHDLIDAAAGLLIKAPPAVIALAVDAALDLGATARGYNNINRAAEEAKTKCKCPCKN